MRLKEMEEKDESNSVRLNGSEIKATQKVGKS